MTDTRVINGLDCKDYNRVSAIRSDSRVQGKNRVSTTLSVPVAKVQLLCRGLKSSLSRGSRRENLLLLVPQHDPSQPGSSCLIADLKPSRTYCRWTLPTSETDRDCKGGRLVRTDCLHYRGGPSLKTPRVRCFSSRWCLQMSQAL